MVRRLFILFLLFACVPRVCEVTLSRAEFQRLAEELAPKVNLFHDAWEKDPKAEFYGGTTRDYLYWLLGKLRKGKTPAELRQLPIIDVREFIIGDSDVDIVSRYHLDLPAKAYGVKKIDSIAPARFDPKTGNTTQDKRRRRIKADWQSVSREALIDYLTEAAAPDPSIAKELLENLDYPYTSAETYASLFRFLERHPLAEGRSRRLLWKHFSQLAVSYSKVAGFRQTMTLPQYRAYERAVSQGIRALEKNGIDVEAEMKKGAPECSLDYAKLSKLSP